ncbi:MAG: RNA methyltransferase [Bacteroides sp.]|nr:RNA methyltransferase [Bacteroides sp.]
MTELTKNIYRTIKGLDERKTRKKEKAFKAEGTKCVTDTLGHFGLRYLFATHEWIESHPSIVRNLGDKLFKVTHNDLSRMSSLTTPSDVIAVYDIPEITPDFTSMSDRLILALDTIQDPGNLGTIIRVADWFGIHDILCSSETADCFSPKVIQSTMGSISRVKLYYGNLPEMIVLTGARNIYGTFLDGTNICETDLDSNGIIVIGNEGKGISQEVESVVTKRLLIPSYPQGQETGESLNAAIATAITVAKFRGI